MEDIHILGHVTHMTGILLDNTTRNLISDLYMHKCLTGIQIIHADSNENKFKNMDIGDCALGLDIDAGSIQHFHHIDFHGNTKNVDDEVKNHEWKDIHGEFLIEILPSDLVGTPVTTGAAGVYGLDTELIALNAIDAPFRIIGVSVDPATSEWYQVRFSANNGVSWYDVIQFDATKREGIAAPPGTEFIFNTGTRISCSAKDVSGVDIVNIWLEIQRI